MSAHNQPIVFITIGGKVQDRMSQAAAGRLEDAISVKSKGKGVYYVGGKVWDGEDMVFYIPDLKTTLTIEQNDTLYDDTASWDSDDDPTILQLHIQAEKPENLVKAFVVCTDTAYEAIKEAGELGKAA